MTTEIQTLPGETLAIGITPPSEGQIKPIEISSQTMLANFDRISHLLSKKELRTPRRASITGAELKRIAKSCQPPQEWFEGEDERPF